VELEFKDEQVIIREPAHKDAIVMSVKSPSPRGDIAFWSIRQQPSTGTALMFTYAIYKIEGDTLTLCIQSAYTIPEDFSDKDQVRWVLKRKGAGAGNAQDKPSASKQDMANLQGTWTAVSMERDGNPTSVEEVRKLDIRLTIKGNEFMLMPLATKGPEHFPHGTFRIDTLEMPKAIDFTILPYYPGMKTSTALGIYEVDGDRLKLLQGRPGQRRPTEFKTMPKSDLEVIVFRRGLPPELKQDEPKAKTVGGKEVKGLVALAELVEKPAKGLFEVRLSLKNVSDKPITICHCPYMSQIQVQWVGPDGKMLTSKHHNYPPSNFVFTKDYFVGIQPGEVRHIVPTIRFHTSTEKRADEPIRKDLGIWDAVDQAGIVYRSNLARAGEHRVTVSYNNVTVGYPVGFGPGGRPGPEQAVENVWTGTITVKEVTFKVK
jgi:uncharacterized protein (TIGR03067 family)